MKSARRSLWDRVLGLGRLEGLGFRATVGRIYGGCIVDTMKNQVKK